MKLFELIYLISEPFLPALYDQIRIRLRHLSKRSKVPLNILDVGGRKSHYTIGLPFQITISDLPRESEVQKTLNLGINETIKKQLLSRRSNVREMIYDDMSHSSLPSDTFDGILAIEVLEHVENDNDFLCQVYRVLKPGGFFLMTTPNGDHIPNGGNPDHLRHYKKSQLGEQIKQVFGRMEEISYIVADTKAHLVGLHSWNIRAPIKTIVGMGSNVLSRQESRKKELLVSDGLTCHLIVLVRKPLDLK